MDKLIFLILLVLGDILVVQTEPIECGPNEQLESCTNMCSSDYCPKTADEDENCISAQVCGPPACKCRFNYRRAENGTCIPTTECPPFDCSKKPFQEYNSCPPYCPNGYCNQATPDGQCPARLGRIGIILECRPQCRCIKNYWKNDEGICIPYGECPGICPENEVYSNCTQTVCNQNCSAAGHIFHCPLVKVEDCKQGCICKANYCRLENGTCVPHDQCKNSKPSLTCSTNEEARCVKDCPPERTCKTRGIQYRCKDDPKPCQEKCVCKNNYFRNLTGDCVSDEQCDKTPKCGSNEEYSCKQSCPPETCQSLVAKYKCDSEALCKEGCHCKSGYLRQDDKSPCIPICQCKEMEYSPDCEHDNCY